ncbi:MAG: MerR family transcriptional regulator [Nitrospiraceae bacterium]|nr:MAG: MerR family transcriptional regulator [Nitrospiraceae bacterium]
MYKPASAKKKQKLPLPDKLFYKIGEVSQRTGVESYVLRYWETEFPFLKPRKNKSGQRVYVKKDLDLILQLKKMLYQDRYTIEGARKKLSEGSLRVSEPLPASDADNSNSQSSVKAIELVKKRLRKMLTQLTS